MRRNAPQRAALLVDAEISPRAPARELAGQAEHQRQCRRQLVGLGKPAHERALEREQLRQASELAAITCYAAVAQEGAPGVVRGRAAQVQMRDDAGAEPERVHDVAKRLARFEHCAVPHPVLEVVAWRRAELDARLAEKLSGCDRGLLAGGGAPNCEAMFGVLLPVVVGGDREPCVERGNGG